MRRAKPRRLRSNRRVERATAKTAFLAANASGGVHREAHRPCPMCSAGADLRKAGRARNMISATFQISTELIIPEEICQEPYAPSRGRRNAPLRST